MSKVPQVTGLPRLSVQLVDDTTYIVKLTQGVFSQWELQGPEIEGAGHRSISRLNPEDGKDAYPTDILWLAWRALSNQKKISVEFEDFLEVVEAVEPFGDDAREVVLDPLDQQD